jgi:BlaI family penicillinase repressor
MNSARTLNPCLDVSCGRTGQQAINRAHCVTVCNVIQRDITKRPLTELQQAILSFMWSRGPSTSEDVRQGLRPRHPLKDSSVRTLLRRLEQRGFVRHSVEGKTFLYTATLRPSSIAARAVQRIIKRFCAGSTEQFLLGMVDEKVLSEEEIRSLAAKIRSRK